MKTLFMVCNAHIDPVWQWKKADGVAAALSTFRSAAALAEEYDFIFCHNEAVLYQWTEENDPALFQKIARLIREGKWKIMGGWYLQPDCNLPCTESIIRQILTGQNYFREKFGVEPNRTAVNLDAFGHGGGLPQLLKKCGQDSYLCCRPMADYCDIPDEFIWRGIDGSEIRGLRSGSYGNDMGKAAEKIEGELKRLSDAEIIPVLWGVGNHGGGPSRADLLAVERLAEEHAERRFVYGIPEEYFENTSAPSDTVQGSLYPCFPGCYSAQIEIKQRYRKLENTYYATEKFASYAELAGLAEYPAKELEQVQEILLFSQFHDILAGTSVRDAYEESLNRIGGGLDLLDRIRTKLMLASVKNALPANEGEYPVFVFNPHPYEVETVLDVPLMMSVRYYEGFADANVYADGARCASQVIKEDSNIPLEWAKKVAFRAILQPMGVTRFDVGFVWKPERPKPVQPRGDFVYECGGKRIVIGKKSGLLEEYSGGGKALISGGGFQPVLCSGNEDPWAMQKYQHIRLGEVVRPFALATAKEAATICNLPQADPVRLIEDGEVFAEIQALFVLDSSILVQTYRIDKKTGDVRTDCEIRFGHADSMVKLMLPCEGFENFSAQIAGGTEQYPADGAERVMHRFAMMGNKEAALAVATDSSYSVSARKGCLELTLLRSAAYTGHYINEELKILPQDRYTPRQDMGEHRFRFLLTGGAVAETEENIHRLSQLMNEEPYALNVFPSGKNREISGIAEIKGKEIALLSMKRGEKGGTVFRISNGANRNNFCTLCVSGQCLQLEFKPFEVKTCLLKNRKLRQLQETIL